MNRDGLKTRRRVCEALGGVNAIGTCSNLRAFRGDYIDSALQLDQRSIQISGAVTLAYIFAQRHVWIVDTVLRLIANCENVIAL